MTWSMVVAAECDHACERVTLQPNGPHHARKDCAVCGRFTGWVSKPDAEKKRRRKGSKRLAFASYCQLCLMSVDDGRSHMCGHHVIEHQHGGSDERANVWTLCEACHALVHHVRTYHGRNNPVTAK